MEKYRTVLRVEDVDGRGPFATTQVRLCDIARYVDWMKCGPMPGLMGLIGGEQVATTPEHPHHMVDVLGANPDGSNIKSVRRLPGQWLVGVKDEAQLHYWFPAKALSFLEENGFRVARYRVPADEVKDGTYQLMFKKSAAKLEA